MSDPKTAEVKVAGPLWMMHVIGPDHIYPAPDHATAVEWCFALNGSVGDPTDVFCVAVPALWAGTSEQHAAGLADAIAVCTPLAAPPAQSGWRTMESAPKTPDDTMIAAPFLGWFADTEAHEGGDQRVCWWEPKIKGGCWWSDRDMCEAPSLWHPLPAAPGEAPASTPAEKGEGEPVANPESCERCKGFGVVTYVSGQTAKSYSEENIDCPDCCPVSPQDTGRGLDLERIAKDAAERVHKNGGCVPQLAFAPILFTLQDALSAQPVSPSEGEAVAWDWRNVEFDGTKTEHLTRYDPRDPSKHDQAWVAEVQPLYTHPVSDQSDTESMRVALEEARDAVAFFDRVKAASQDEQIAVGRDHWNRLEAAIRAVAALGEA